MRRNGTDAIERRLSLLAQAIAADASAQTPDADAWGLCCAETGIGRTPTGSREFLWFDSQPALLEFVGAYVAYLGVEPAGGWAAAARACRTTIEQLVSDAIDPETALQHLNTHLYASLQIVWWGPFVDLVTGDQPLPREVRGWWYGMIEEPDELEIEEAPPIDPDDMGDFAEDLWQFGI